MLDGEAAMTDVLTLPTHTRIKGSKDKDRDPNIFRRCSERRTHDL